MSEYDSTLVPEVGRSIKVRDPIHSRHIVGLPIEAGDVLHVKEMFEFGSSHSIVYETEDGTEIHDKVNKAKVWSDTKQFVSVSNSQGANQSFKWDYTKE